MISAAQKRTAGYSGMKPELERVQAVCKGPPRASVIVGAVYATVVGNVDNTFLGRVKGDPVVICMALFKRREIVDRNFPTCIGIRSPTIQHVLRGKDQVLIKRIYGDAVSPVTLPEVVPCSVQGLRSPHHT